ncbi:MAG: insulinase family protein, partial [Nitrospirae bacterium]
MRKQLVKCTLFLIALALFIPAKGWPIDAKRVVLPNGLTLLFSERHNLPIIKATMLIKASPINEPEEKAGLANLTAELLMEGTKTRSSEEISEAIEFIGGDLSVSTERDYTELELSILKKDIKTGFSILSDILLNPAFSEKEITRKRDILKGALRQREEDPSFLGSRAFRKAVFTTSHPYGRIIEGSTNTLDGITREDIINFHKKWYRPNNAILSVVGDISFDELNGLIQEFFGTWKPSEANPPSIPPVSVPEKPEVITIQKDLTQANIFIGHLGVKRSNPDYYALSVMNYILGGGGFASRLMTRIRDDLGLA